MSTHTTQEQRRGRYHYFKSRQRCTRCGTQDAYTLNGRCYCAECDTLQKAYHEKYRREKRESYLNALKKRNEVRGKLKDAGLCVYCGKKAAKNGLSGCEICLAKKRRNERVAREEKRQLRIERECNGLCIFCGKPVKAGFTRDGRAYKICPECVEKRRRKCQKAD